MRKRLLPPALLLFVLLSGCDTGPAEYRFDGWTMGTQYLVHAWCDTPVDDIEAEVDAILRDVNDQMSTFQEDSLLSQFNAAPIGEWVSVTPEMVEVVGAALELSERSAGAFDVTVGPLVNLWGFGPDGRPENPPGEAELEAARARTGYQHLEVRESPPALRKSRDLYVDLSAIAKGHGVDRVTEALTALQCPSVLVEIGGDLRATGPKPDGTPWRIGVEVPDRERRGGVQEVVNVIDISVATSGDYRNFEEWDGVHASHIIDPRTGQPALTDIRSVTVLHASNMWADGYATLIDVLGPDEGYAFAESYELPVMLIVQTDDGLQVRTTPGFDGWLSQE